MLPWEDALEGYWLAKRQNLSNNTVIEYDRTFRRFGEWVGQVDVDEITTTNVRAFLLHLKEDCGLAPKTVANSWVGLSSLWSWLHSEFGVTHILKKVDRPKFQRKSPEPFTENEVKRLLTACHAMKAYDPINECYVEGLRPSAARDYAIMVVLVATGIRASELCDLNVADYDKKRGKITIHHGKGDKMRILYVGTTAMQRMWRYLLVRGKKLAPSEPLFLGKFGDRMTPSSLRQMVKRAGRRADVEKAHPHRFRHTFAINFLRNGGSVLELKEMLGHEKLETVLIYARLAEVDLEMAQRRSNVADTWNL